jgi:hypothetical protein
MFIRKHCFLLLSALLVTVFVTARFAIVRRTQAEEARPYGRYTAQQMIEISRKLSSKISPGATNLQHVLTECGGPFPSLPSGVALLSGMKASFLEGSAGKENDTMQRWMISLWVGALCLLSADVWAQKNVGADVTTRFEQRQNVTNGTSAFFVYSNQTMRSGVADPVGPNAQKGHTMSGPLNAFQSLTASLSVADGVANNIGGRTYSPVLGVNNRPKPANPYDRETVWSTSGAFEGAGMVEVKSARTATDRISASASCVDGVGAAGAASAIVYDPYSVSPGVYNYNHNIDVSLNREGPTSFAGVLFQAVDDRYTDPLWSLQILADQQLRDVNDLGIQFAFNSQALLDGVLTNDSTLLTDSAMIDRIRENIDLSTGVPTLTGFDLFPTGTTYNVDRSIQYGVDAGAALSEDTPEPGALAILAGFGVSGSVLALKRRPRATVSRSVLRGHNDLPSASIW